MTYLLDTNVVSEWVRPRPDPGVMAFLSSTDEDLLFLSVITLAELRRGVERLPSGRRRAALNDWLEDDLSQRFDGRMLGVDAPVAGIWGRIMAREQRGGRTPGVMDVWIASIAEARGLILVTRDTTDFTPLVGRVFNPWGTSGQGRTPSG